MVAEEQRSTAKEEELGMVVAEEQGTAVEEEKEELGSGGGGPHATSREAFGSAMLDFALGGRYTSVAFVVVHPTANQKS